MLALDRVGHFVIGVHIPEEFILNWRHLLTSWRASKPYTKLRTNCDAYDEGRLHYFEKHSPIPKGSEVEVIGTLHNFFGEYLRCRYNGQIYDVKPINLEALED